MKEGRVRLFPPELVLQPHLSSRRESTRIVQRDGRDIDGARLAIAFVSKRGAARTAECARYE